MDTFNTWFWGVLLGLHLLSWIYNWLIDQLHHREWMDDWTWLTVVIGVGYTLIGSAVAMWNAPMSANEAIVGVLLTFVATGIPMSAGDVWRVLRWRGNGGEMVVGLGNPESEQEAAEGKTDDSSNNDGASRP